MSDLDERIEDLWANYCRMGTMEEFTTEAKQAIQQWALDIVGEDEPTRPEFEESDPESLSEADFRNARKYIEFGGQRATMNVISRNHLRAELRKQIKGEE